MIFRNYNDFEIVNMIKQGNEEAFGFMIDKYKFLIAKNIGKFNLTDQYDDVFQESLMILYKSVVKFDDTFNKTFMRFFEMNLTNKLISIKKKNNRYGQFLSEKMPALYNSSLPELNVYTISDSEIKQALMMLSNFEKVVFQAKIIGNRTVKETALYLNCEEKKIYNALDRIKNKIKMQLM